MIGVLLCARTKHRHQTASIHWSLPLVSLASVFKSVPSPPSYCCSTRYSRVLMLVRMNGEHPAGVVDSVGVCMTKQSAGSLTLSAPMGYFENEPSSNATTASPPPCHVDSRSRTPSQLLFSISEWQRYPAVPFRTTNETRARNGDLSARPLSSTDGLQGNARPVSRG